jgi:hypothetical protein
MDDPELDTLAFRWRGALDIAAESLDELTRSRRALQLSSTELRSRVAELDRERDTTELDLVRLAAATHTRLHRHMRGVAPAAPTRSERRASCRPS